VVQPAEHLCLRPEVETGKSNNAATAMLPAIAVERDSRVGIKLGWLPGRVARPFLVPKSCRSRRGTHRLTIDMVLLGGPTSMMTEFWELAPNAGWR
jgi:hypothetical protein